MTAKRRTVVFLLSGIALSVLVFFALSYLPMSLLPMSLLPMQQKPTPQPIYDYYEIIDENGGESLMMVPLVVNVGDELLTEDNRMYKVVKVIENIAYARKLKSTLPLPEKKQ